MANQVLQKMSQKIFSDDIRIGFLASAQSMSNKIIEGNLSSDEIDILEKLIFNLKLDTGITIFLVSILWIVVFDVLRIATKQKDYELKEVANV